MPQVNGEIAVKQPPPEHGQYLEGRYAEKDSIWMLHVGIQKRTLKNIFDLHFTSVKLNFCIISQNYYPN